MSSVNIQRAVDNIKSGTTIYTPIVELIVNSIQAIDSVDQKNGNIKVIAHRSPQLEIDNSLPEIISITVLDNGIGFNSENRDSFDTLYSDYKLRQGGKGFGRFICLKYFENLRIDSSYVENETFLNRNFSMGRKTEIIINEKISKAEKEVLETKVILENAKNKNLLDKNLGSIARSLVEKLLPYFITENYTCPDISLEEEDGSSKIILNDYVRRSDAIIKELDVKENQFELGSEINHQVFLVRIFKIYSPRNKVSKISLVADRREVIETSIQTYIPEFSEEFYDKNFSEFEQRGRNYIIKTYVFGDYLDAHVSLERDSFAFQKDGESLIYGISQAQIEAKAAELTNLAVEGEISSRVEKKKKRINSYVEEAAPWHRGILESIDISKFPYNPEDEEIEILLQKEKIKRESDIRRELAVVLEDDDSKSFRQEAAKIVEKISESGKNDLIHYIALRRKILDVFRKSLKIDNSGEYASEATLHDIIFPRKGDSKSIDYYDHNLWIVDERLNFTYWISSDQPLKGGKSARPDLLIYDQRVAFRGDNESSNPITIFEFKRPGRDDFINPSSKEDPVAQIIRYVNNIRDGEFKTPEGFEINVTLNTPFYGYVICTTSKKVKSWLELEKNFTEMPDGMGWFQYRDKINLYVEVVSWDKILKDADMRNKIFFHKLGI